MPTECSLFGNKVRTGNPNYRKFFANWKMLYLRDGQDQHRINTVWYAERAMRLALILKNEV